MSNEEKEGLIKLIQSEDVVNLKLAISIAGVDKIFNIIITEWDEHKCKLRNHETFNIGCIKVILHLDHLSCIKISGVINKYFFTIESLKLYLKMILDYIDKDYK